MSAIPVLMQLRPADEVAKRQLCLFVVIMERSDFNSRRSFFEDAIDRRHPKKPSDSKQSMKMAARSDSSERSFIEYPAFSSTIMTSSPTESEVASPRAASLSTNAAITKLSPIQLREVRDAFQVLDRDHDGQVDPEDIAVMLSSLGLDANEASLASFFQQDMPQSINLPVFLTIIAELLEPFPPSTELENALAAFDEDDSGLIDLADLREALVQTNPAENGSDRSSLTENQLYEVVRDFTSSSALPRTPASKRLMRREVFRYQEFVSNITGAIGTEGAVARVGE